MHNWLNKKNGAGALVVYLLTGLALYAGLLNKSFSADDYQVVYRVTQDGLLFPPGFFRPLSDLTIWLNGLYGGFHSIAYFSFNLLIHIAAAFAVFQFCRLSAPIWQIASPWFPFLGGLLFLVYPFHNEPVLWVVGRGASMAALFGIIALCAVLSGWQQQTKLLVFTLCYFLSLAAYETLMPLPVIAALLVYYREPENNSWNRWLGVGTLVFLVHLLIRFTVSGGLLGNYAAHIRTQSLSIWGGHWLRLMARLFVPPAPSNNQFLMQTAGVFLVLLGLILIFLRKHTNRETRSLLLLLFVLIQLSLIVPVSFPVSTRTSETDRLLYFPALWVCLFLVVLGKGLFDRTSLRLIAYSGLVGVCVFFLLLNNSNWKSASQQSKSMLADLKKITASGPVVLLNLPDEYYGAFMFRNGFREALLMEGIDTARVSVVSQLRPQDYPDVISLNVTDSLHASLPPHHELQITANAGLLITGNKDKSWALPSRETVVGYWDKENFHWVHLPFKKTDD